MSKRIIRVFGREVLDVADKLKNRNVNLILLTGDSYLGVFKAVSGDVIEMVDHRNHAHKFPLSSVESIIWDQRSSW